MFSSLFDVRLYPLTDYTTIFYNIKTHKMQHSQKEIDNLCNSFQNGKTGSS